MSEARMVLGRDLSSEELAVMNEFRKKEFGSASVVAPRAGDDNWDKPYFLVKDQGKVGAFGRLHQTIDVDFQEVRHQILGIASVVAIIKGRGYGRELTREIKHYIDESGLTAIGFCAAETSPFYAKCGYQILVGGMKRFRFVSEDGRELPPDHAEGDVLYLDGGGLMPGVIQYADDQVTAHRAAW